MSAAKLMQEQLGLRKSLKHSGVSRRQWYYKPVPRETGLNPVVVDAIRRISERRPTYGTRRMAAQITREAGTPTNRKQVQRICRKIGHIQPQKKKNEIIRAGRRLFKPEAPNRLWETDVTYVWCGMDGWCYCFNVVDCFTRKWIAYAFDVHATRYAAIDSITNAVAAERPGCSRLRLRTDNGNQYTSRDFRRAVQALGIGKHEFIWKNTPEQNGHVESFHKTLKKEYVWPREFANYQEAGQAIAEAFADYNTERIHSSIGYMTPAEFAELWEMTNK